MSATWSRSSGYSGWNCAYSRPPASSPSGGGGSTCCRVLRDGVSKSGICCNLDTRLMHKTKLSQTHTYAHTHKRHAVKHTHTSINSFLVCALRWRALDKLHGERVHTMPLHIHKEKSANKKCQVGFSTNFIEREFRKSSS